MAKKNVDLIVAALNALFASPDVVLDMDNKTVHIVREPGIKMLGRIDCLVNHAGWSRG